MNAFSIVRGCWLLALTAGLAACSGSERTSSTGAPVSGLQCPEVALCVRGDHWDGQACRCVPDDAGASEAGAAASDADVDAGCVEAALCARGHHFDRGTCQCVPDDPGTSAQDACVDTALCVHGDHFDRSLCRCVPDEANGGDAADACPAAP